MSHNPHITQVLLSPRIGGAETLVASLASGFTAKGIGNDVVYLDPDDAGQGIGVRVSHLARELRRRGSSHVLAHSALPNLYARLAAPLGASVTCVLHSAADDFADAKLRRAERLLLKRTHAVVAVSAVQFAQYRKRFGRNVPLYLVNNGIAETAPTKKDLAPAPVRIISMARVAEQKDPKTWETIALLAAEQGLPYKFEWWGPATDEWAQGLIKRHEHAAQPGTFRGPTARGAEELVAADVFLHTALHEANSIVIMEAAAAGLPIICTDEVAEGVAPEVVRVSFPGGDASAGLRTLQAVERDWSDLALRALQSSATVKSHYGMDTVTERYLSILGLR